MGFPVVPVVVVTGLVAGGIGLFEFFTHKKKPAAPLPEPSKPQPGKEIPIPTVPVDISPADAELHKMAEAILDTASDVAHSVLGLFHGDFGADATPKKGKNPLIDIVQKQGKAVAYARPLYNYLLIHKVDGTPVLSGLVKAFQTAHNADPNAVKLVGTITTSGRFDAPTSAALSLYTGDPQPADPSAPLPAPPTVGEQLTKKEPGAAARSGFNLRQYLKSHKYDPSDAKLHAMTLQFQHDVNTDPLYPGPAWVKSPPPPFRVQKLTEDGNMGKAGSKTRAALLVLYPGQLP